MDEKLLKGYFSKGTDLSVHNQLRLNSISKNLTRDQEKL